MARMPFLSRRRDEGPSEPPAAEAAPAPQRRPLPSASRLRRERRTLLRVREERIRDLGGLVLLIAFFAGWGRRATQSQP